jgi:hypothetical protein
MLAKLRSMKSKHIALENKLKEELNRPMADQFVVIEMKKKKLQIKDTINRLIRKKSANRKKRYSLRTKRLTRIGNFA